MTNLQVGACGYMCKQGVVGAQNRAHRLTGVRDGNINLRVGMCTSKHHTKLKWGSDLQLDKPRELALEGLPGLRDDVHAHP